jgi:hypothetical protein
MVVDMVVDVVVDGAVVLIGGVLVEVVVVSTAVLDGSVDVALTDGVVAGSSSAVPSEPPQAAHNSAAQMLNAMVVVRARCIVAIVGSCRCVMSERIGSVATSVPPPERHRRVRAAR